MALVMFYVPPLLLLFSVVVMSSSLWLTVFFCWFYFIPLHFIIPIISGLTSFIIPASKNKNDNVHPPHRRKKSQTENSTYSSLTNSLNEWGERL